MKKKIKILVANPSGNITIFVLDKVPRKDYARVAKALLQREELRGEQVAFVCSENEMEMAGLEFCGNATRAFALLMGKRRGLKGYNKMNVKVSGAKEPLDVDFDTEKNYASVKMPKIESVRVLKDTPVDFLNGATYVEIDGISHVTVYGIEATDENFNKAKKYLMEAFNPAALGVMFYNTEKQELTPVVYVKDVDSTYFEGSCGSGSTAVAIAMSESEPDGSYKYDLAQPKGVISVTVEKLDGKVKAVYISGPISLSEEMVTEIDI